MEITNSQQQINIINNFRIMKMHLSTLLLPLCFTAQGQNYSTFYGTYNVKQDVNVSGTVNQNVNKTISTIDYGALAMANAQKEANRLKANQYDDARNSQIALAIAADPYAAYTFGNEVKRTFSRTESRKLLSPLGHGGQNVFWSVIEPHKFLFSKAGFGEFRNTSSDGVVLCELDITLVYNFSKVQSNLGKEAMPDSLGSARALANVVMRKKVGEVERFEDENMFTHKTEMGTATVYGNKGYRATWIYESEFNYVVKDNYYAFNNGIMYTCGVRYTVEKARGNFEDLEGRRFYLRRLCEEIIATSRLYYL